MTRPWLLFIVGAALVSAAACNGSSPVISTSTPAPAATPTVVLRAPGTGTVPALTVTSTAFANGGTIPTVEAAVACGGTNTSPDLTWTAAPSTAKSYVVTEFDPDAPTGVGFWHWILYNIPSTTLTLAAGAGTAPPAGTTSGLNDYGAVGYGGPCPPTGDGNHHYIITVSALDVVLSGLPSPTTGAYLTFNMRGHIVAQGTYVGLFSK